MGLSKESIIECLRESYGESVSSAEVKAFCQMNDFNYQTITNKLTDYKVGRGKWNLTVKEKLEQSFQAPAALPAIEQNLTPQKDDSFVQFGNFGDVKKIIKSRLFYPTFITGLSGNGKTFSVEQACAQLGRELIRVNITVETDEDDLIGGFRLVNGETVWHNGPALKPCNGVLCCSLMRSTSPQTKSSVFNLFLKGKEFSSRRLASGLPPQKVSTYSQLPIPKAKDLTMDDSLELTCSTKHSLSGSL